MEEGDGVDDASDISGIKLSRPEVHWTRPWRRTLSRSMGIMSIPNFDDDLNMDDGTAGILSVTMNNNEELFKRLPMSSGQRLQRLHPIRQLSQAAVALENDPALSVAEVNGKDKVAGAGDEKGGVMKEEVLRMVMGLAIASARRQKERERFETPPPTQTFPAVIDSEAEAPDPWLDVSVDMDGLFSRIGQ